MNSVLQKQDIMRMREIALNALKEESSGAGAKKACASNQFLVKKGRQKRRDTKGVQQKYAADQLLIHGMNIFFYLIIFCCILLAAALILFFIIER